MDGLNELRGALDALDAELAALCERRFTLTDEIGAVKRANALPVRDHAREEEVLRRVRECVQEDKKDDVCAVFAALMAASRRRQEEKR